jgi:hypothetical protein
VLAFSGYSFGNTNNPQSSGEKVYSLRDDFATSFDLGGRHDIKAGGEWIRYTMDTAWCNNCNGTLGFNVAPPANIESLIPNAMDASTWNLRALSPLVRDYRIAIGDFAWAIKRNIFAGWLQDDQLVIKERLTHQEIANRVGASREMVSRIMKDLCTGGYIQIRDHKIFIQEKLPPGW